MQEPEAGSPLKIKLSRQQLAQEVFTINSVLLACQFLPVTMFPNNKHVRENLRQHMQLLSDSGLVLFLGGRRYQHLASTQ